MAGEADRLAAAYFDKGTLAGLPDQHFIDGRWAPPVSGATMETFDAGLGRPYHRFAAGDGDDIARAVEAASKAGRAWGATRPAARGTVLSRAAALLR